MNDPLLAARTLVEQGDFDGAERVLATAALAGGPACDRAARALGLLCERRGEIGMRAQEALDAYLVRSPGGTEHVDVLKRVRALYVSLGLSELPPMRVRKPAANLADLPDLDGFNRRPAEAPATEKNVRIQTLADVASELDISSASSIDSSAPDDGDAFTDVKTEQTPQPQPAKPAPDIRLPFGPGSVVNDRYEVRAEIGRGGHATVLRVFDRELDEDCALKVFHNTGNAGDVARFKREVSISRKIVHENVIKLYDLGSEGGFYYLTMELLEGSDLATVMKAGRVTMQQALRWLIDACRGLQAAHSKGVVHRDVKPGNLFVLTSGALKVTDFGIAKPADALSLTSTGMFVGTPQFVSPEQVKGGEITGAADIYSLGVVAYTLFAGGLPFRDKELMALLMKHATVRPEPPRARNPNLPPELDALIMRCLEKAPADRPGSCAEIAADLERFVAQRAERR